MYWGVNYITVRRGISGDGAAATDDDDPDVAVSFFAAVVCVYFPLLSTAGCEPRTQQTKRIKIACHCRPEKKDLKNEVNFDCWGALQNSLRCYENRGKEEE